MRLVQWGRVISVLSVMNEVDDEESFEEEIYSDDSDSETELMDEPKFPPSANIQILNHQRNSRNTLPARGLPPIQRVRRPIEKDTRVFHITHFDVYTAEDSITYEIKTMRGYEPRDFCVHAQDQCAILWDDAEGHGKPTEDAFVMGYREASVSVVDDDSPYETYSETKIWPKSKDGSRHEESDIDDPPEHLASSISFFKDGRRLRVYESSGTVPFEVCSTTARTESYNYISTNQLAFGPFSFHVDTPFYGTHSTFFDEAYQERYCFLTHLCLGVTDMSLGAIDNARVLCILRAQTRYYPTDCNHGVALSRMAHVSANNATVVARLWGWEEMHSTLATKDVISISPGGTRIAIAMWDKIYVYPLNPRILCQETVVDSDDEVLARPKKKKRKYNKPWETKATNYYQRSKYPNLMNWNIVDLKPVVLDLHGAVAHKLSWSTTKGRVTDTIMPEVDTHEPVEEIEVFTFDDDTTSPEASAEQSDQLIVTTTLVVGTEHTIQEQSNDATSPGSASSDQTTIPSAENADSHVPVEVSLSSVATAGAMETADTTKETTADVKQEEQQQSSDTIVEAPVMDDCPCSTVLSTENAMVEQTSSTPETVPSASLETNPPTAVQQDRPPTLTTTYSTLPLASPTTFTSTNLISTEPPTPKSLPRKDKTIEIKNEHSKKVSPVAFISYKPIDKILMTQMKESIKITPTVAQVLANEMASSPHTPPAEATATPEQTKEELAPHETLYEEAETVKGEEAGVDKEAVQESVEVSELSDDLSKTSINADMQETSNQALNAELPEDETEVDVGNTTIDTEEGTVQMQPNKRITEDELIILTDRGVQIWNMGAMAKGTRKRKLLPLEESLQGKLPAMKGKSRID